MESNSCSLLINKLQLLYTFENLDEFLQWTPDKGEFHNQITINEKNSTSTIGRVHLRVSNNNIRIGLITRKTFHNFRNSYYKGLGKALLYIIVCKAIELGYTISFTSNPSNGNKLEKYYESIGFTKKRENSRNFLTMPTQENFNESIRVTTEELKNISVIESYEPNWIKREKYGDWIIECPLCHRQSGSLLQIEHIKECPNAYKKPDISKKPSEGGRKTLRKKKRNTFTKKRV